MRKKIRVEVKAEHIENGVQLHGNNCAVALALAEAGVIEPCVSDRHFEYTVDHAFSSGARPLPKAAQNFIARFDADKSKCKPFAFTVSL